MEVGYSLGSIVYTRLECDDVAGTIRAGEWGEVLGTETEGYVLCRFPSFLRVQLEIDHICLAGSYTPGTVIHSKVGFHNGGQQVQSGDQGTVLGSQKAGVLLCMFHNSVQVHLEVDQISLAGGYTPGMLVVSRSNFSHQDGIVSKGDLGVVLGAVSDGLLLCKFADFQRVQVAVDQICLSAGYAPGMLIFSRSDYEHADGTIKKGEQGEVLGSEFADYLTCRFVGFQRVQLACTHVSLFGGFTPGTTVFLKHDVSNAHGHLAVDSQGEVIDSDSDGFLLCRFQDFPVMRLSPALVSLVGGYNPETVIMSKSNFKLAEWSIAKGELGEVLGSESGCNLVCAFPNFPRVRLEIRDVSLVGGYVPGTVIYSVVNARHGEWSVQIGDLGRVLGSQSPGHLLCSFPDFPRAQVEVDQVSLAGGYVPGTIVYLLSDHTHDDQSIGQGARGEVLGSDKAGFVLCAFPSFSRLEVDVGQVTLVGGYTPGTVLYSAHDFRHRCKRVRKGDCGAVLGCQAEGYLLCCFQDLPQVQLTSVQVSLAGGYIPGTVIISKQVISHIDGDVQKGEVGEVVGSREENSLFCAFSNGVRIPLEVCQVCLSHGYTPRMVIFAKIDIVHADGCVNKGEQGEVCGSGAAGFLTCTFPRFTHVQVSASDVSLAGGYVPGGVIFASSSLKHARGNVQKHERGEVIGSGRDGYLVCAFSGLAQCHVEPSRITFVAGYTPGMVVYARTSHEHAAGVIKKGERGEVFGSEKVGYLLCCFLGISRVHIEFHSLSLAGGYAPRTTVYSRSDFQQSCEKITKGESGKVLDSGLHGQLICSFPCFRRVQLEVDQVCLVGGYVPGANIFLRQALRHAHGAAEEGEIGEVLGSEKDGYLLCRFANFDRVQLLPSQVSLLGGYVPGSAVLSNCAFSHARGSIAKDEQGEVVGSGDDNRLLCKFPGMQPVRITIDRLRLGDA